MHGSVKAESPALEVLNLSVSFDRMNVIEGLSFEVARGSALAIIGPNGAGEGVLARALIGALPSLHRHHPLGDTHKARLCAAKARHRTLLANLKS
jgi:ABC-type Mn2+/Zn2+ transport system ATPase subunit